MKSTSVRTNIASQGPFFSRSAKCCLIGAFCPGGGRIRSFVVANVMKKSTTASAEKMPIVYW